MKNISINKSNIYIPFLLLLIFLVPIFLFNGISDPINTFHASDELNYHYPIIQKFFITFPKFELSRYESATTPLYYIIFSTLGRIINSDLITYRIINLIISYMAVLVFYKFSKKILRLNIINSFFASLVVGLSPYFYGISFRVLTDNLGVLFFFIALLNIFDFYKEKKIESYAYSLLFISLSILTRQFYLWLFLFLNGIILISNLNYEKKLKLILGSIVSIIPYAILILEWGGLAPPTFQNHMAQFETNRFMSIIFFMACLGFYLLIIMATSIFNYSKYNFYLVLTSFALSALILYCIPMHYGTYNGFPTDGYLWRISTFFPNLFDSSFIFYPLIATSLYFILEIIINDNYKNPIVLMIISFLIVLSNSASLYQKYFDMVAIICAIYIATIYTSNLKYSLIILSIIFTLYNIYSALSLSM